MLLAKHGSFATANNASKSFGPKRAHPQKFALKHRLQIEGPSITLTLRAVGSPYPGFAQCQCAVVASRLTSLPGHLAPGRSYSQCGRSATGPGHRRDRQGRPGVHPQGALLRRRTASRYHDQSPVPQQAAAT